MGPRASAVILAPAAGLAGLIVLALITMLSAGPALAHAELVRMVPAQGSTVRVAPTVVQLTFDEAVQPRYDVVAVTAPDGTRVSAGAPQVAQTVVRQSLRPLSAAGRYTVTYRLVSADGHLVSRQVSFTFAPTAGASASPPPASGSPGSNPSSLAVSGVAAPRTAAKGGGSRSPLVAVTVIVVVLLAGAAVLVWRRRQRPT